MTFLDTVRGRASGVQYGRLLASALLVIPYVVGWLFKWGATAITAALYALGWLARKTALAGRYAISAFQVGWHDAGAKKPGGGRWAS